VACSAWSRSSRCPGPWWRSKRRAGVVSVAVTSDLSQLSFPSISAASSGSRPEWPTAGFEVAVCRAQGFVAVRLRGSLDVGTSPRLALVLSSLLGDGCSSVGLDLAELEFLDRGSAWLIGEATRLFNEHGAELVVHSPCGSVPQGLDSAQPSPLVETNPAAVDHALLPS
jgi:anti-anti-sigma factor